MKRMCSLLVAALWVCHAAFAVNASEGSLRIETLVSGLDQPWAVAPLPGGGMLVTERDGDLLHIDAHGHKSALKGVPDVVASGQGGLLDVTVPRDFATSREVFLTYSKAMPGGVGTALAVGRLQKDSRALVDLRVIFQASEGREGGRHFGSRVVEARDGTLFVTIGDRGDRPSAQDRGNHNGTIVRINRDGAVPSDNPFVGKPDMRSEIWSWGHRNPQGATLDLNGNLWTSEHGAQGGDEVNRIRKGANFGWPVISYGRHYSGGKIGEGTSKPGMEQPEHYWDPSIAPSGAMIYSGTLWPEWRGDMFVGSLKFDYISRLSGQHMLEVEQIRLPQTARVRDIIEAPDGSIWFISVGEGAVYRLSPG